MARRWETGWRPISEEKGNVEIDAGRIVLGFGSDLTGITWKGPMPRD